MPRDQDCRTVEHSMALFTLSKARAQLQPLLLCLSASFSGLLRSRKQTVGSLHLPLCPPCFWNISNVEPCKALYYIWLSEQGDRGSSAEKVCDLSKQHCNTLSSGLDLCNTLWPYVVSERGCQSCQSTTIHLSHKAIKCDSKHSSWAKSVLKNYLKASRWKAVSFK